MAQRRELCILPRPGASDEWSSAGQVGSFNSNTQICQLRNESGNGSEQSSIWDDLYVRDHASPFAGA